MDGSRPPDSATGRDAEVVDASTPDATRDAGCETPGTCGETPGVDWLLHFGTDQADRGEGIDVHSTGDIVVVGTYGEDADLGGEALEHFGSADIFVSRIDARGTVVWTRLIHSFLVEGTPRVRVDGDEILVAGTTGGNIDFGDGSLTAPLSPCDVFIARYRFSDGGLIAAQRFALGGTRPSRNTCAVRDLHVLPDGGAAIAGEFWGSPAMFGGVDTRSHDGFALRVDSGLTLAWARRFGSGSTRNEFATAVTSVSDVVVVAGGFTRTVDFGLGPTSSAGGGDAFLAAYDVRGDPVWVRTYGGVDNEIAVHVLALPGGDLILATLGEGGLDLGGGPLPDQPGPQDASLARMSSSGVHQWSLTFGAVGLDKIETLTLAPDGRVVLAGSFGSTLTLGDTSLVGDTGFWFDALVAALDPTDGTFLWAFGFGGPEEDFAQEVAVSADGSVFVVGFAKQTADVLGTTITSRGVEDGLVMRVRL